MYITDKNDKLLCICAKALTSGTVFLAFILCFISGGCGKPPASMPDPYTGALNVTVMDTASVDSVFVKLDDDAPGKHENPTLIENIMIGIHKVFVFNEASAGTTKTVEIFRDRTSDILFWLATTGPYVGNLAPDFSTQDIKGNPVSLSGLKGKVVLLVFFEHT